MPCTADPGYYCPPLNPYPLICPENWYCPGGQATARRCPDNRWSAVASVYPEDCKEYQNVVAMVAIVLLFMLIILGFCIWFSSWAAWKRKYEYAELEPFYGTHNSPGQKYGVRTVIVHP